MTDLPVTHDFINLPERLGPNTKPVLDAFEQNAVGRRIVELEDTAMVLDDGTRLEFVAYPDCCACGWIDSFKAVENLEQATITRVEEVDIDKPEDGYRDEDHYRVTIFGGDRRLADLPHTTDHSNGYYTSAVEVDVIKRKPGHPASDTKKDGKDR